MRLRKGELLAPDGAGGGGSSTATETPSTDTPPQRIIDDPILSVLADDLADMLKREKEPAKAPEIKPVPEETPAPDAASKTTDPVTPEPIRGGVKKRVDPAKVAEDVFNRKMEELKNAPAPVLPPKKDEPAPVADTIDPDQAEELADAAFAEQSDPEKFKGFQGKLKAFYKSVDDWVAARKSDPDRTFDENDAEFVKFIEKNKPSWNGQRDRMRIERIADARAEQKLKSRDEETSRKIAEAQREAREAKFSPAIQNQVTSVMQQYDSDTKTDDPLESEVFSQYRESAAELSTDYLRVVNGIDTIGSHNPPHVQQRHDWILNFVVASAEARAKQKPDETMRDGRRFVTPAKFIELRNANDPGISKVYTFTVDDVLGLIKEKAISMAKSAIKAEEDRAIKRGFVRAKPTGNTKQAEQPKPMNPPRATSAPAPGAVEASNSNDAAHPGRELIDILGLRS